MKLRVFVSYGHDDYTTFAQSIAQQLEADGHEVWFDAQRIKPGGDWEQYIEEGLDWVSQDPTIGRILLIMTPHSVRRPDGYCLNEIAKALDSHLKILPVMLVWTTPPLSIYRIQYLDLTSSVNKIELTQSFKTDYSRIVEALTSPEQEINTQYISLFNTLNPLSFESDLVLNQTWFVGREWVFNEINNWLQDENASRLFWITGVPGIGKTAVAVKLLQRYPEIAAYHICRRGHSEKSSPRRAICTIAYQLSNQLPEYKAIIERFDIQNILQTYGDSALFDTLITQPLNMLSPTSFQQKYIIILIDGLDEATDGSENSLANFIASEFDRLPSWVRFVITSRNDPIVRTPLQSFSPWYLDPDNVSNQHDIDNYIKERLSLHKHSPYYLSSCDTIKKNSEGVFLYAKHVCDEIINGHLSITNPETFPKGLGGIYYQYFHTQFEQISDYDTLLRPALELIVARQEPITTDALKRYLHWNNYQVITFTRRMGAFFIQKPDATLQPFHLSLIDWLTDMDKAGPYWIDKEAGNDIIIDYHLQHDTTSYYALSHLLKHMAYTRQSMFIEFLSNQEYIDLRKSSMGKAVFFKTLLDDLGYYYHNSGDMDKVFSNHNFQSIIIQDHIYFFDHDYYRLLRQWGFDHYIHKLDIASCSFNIRCILIAYYYIIYDIKATANVPLGLPSDDELSHASQEQLDSYRLIYELKASAYRIIGEFDNAKRYIQIALKSSELLMRQDYLLVLNSVYARIEMHEQKYDSAITRLNQAIAKGESLIANLSYEYDLHKIQHIRTGSTLILIEQYLNLGRIEHIAELLQQMKLLYQKPQDRDRYWSRYLYMSALYAIQTQDEEQFLYFQKELSPYSLHVKGGRLFYHSALYAYVKGGSAHNQQLLTEALNEINIYIEKAHERYDLELVAEGIALKQEILIAMGMNEVPVPEYMNAFQSWICLKRNLFKSLLDKYSASPTLPFCQSCDRGTQFDHK